MAVVSLVLQLVFSFHMIKAKRYNSRLFDNYYHTKCKMLVPTQLCTVFNYVLFCLFGLFYFFGCFQCLQRAVNKEKKKRTGDMHIVRIV